MREKEDEWDKSKNGKSKNKTDAEILHLKVGEVLNQDLQFSPQLV